MGVTQTLNEHGLSIGEAKLIGYLEFESPAKIGTNVTTCDVSLGAYSYVEVDGAIYNTTIGAYCSLGQDCRIGLPTHNLAAVTTHPFPTRNLFSRQVGDYPDKVEFDAEKRFVTIASDVWMGSGAIVVGAKPTHVGVGAVIAAGAVVVKDVEPYMIVGGNPARPIRRRFTDAVCDQLLQTRWWTFDLPRYAAAHPNDAPPLGDPEAFLAWWQAGGGQRLEGSRLGGRRFRVRRSGDGWRVSRIS